MTGELEYSLPPAIRRISSAFRRVGWISFWAQVVLAVVASGILLFASATVGNRSGGGQPNPGTGAGLALASIGLITVYVSAFWAYRYTRLGRRLRSSDSAKRPTPKEAVQALRIGLIISMAGMLVTLLGGEALIGALLAKALTQPSGTAIFNAGSVSQYVQAFDIFIVQANTNTLLAHFAALAATLWLLRTVNRA
jgi:hypothetical protein